MKNQTFKFTVLVGAFWIFIMGLINLVLKKNGIGYDTGWAITSLTFIGSAVIFNYTTNSIQISLKQLKSILIIIVFFLLIALGLNYLFPIPVIKKLEIINSKILFPLFNWNIFIAKSSDIIFQQILINILIEHYIKHHSRDKSVVYFGLFFAIIHLPLFYLFGLHALYFIIPSIIGGLIFAWLIAYFHRGYLLSAICHFSFYIVVGVFLRYFN